MAGQIASIVFLSRNLAQEEHWATSSGFHHEALGEFYIDVISALDKFVEAYQGRYEKVGKITSISLKNGKSIYDKLLLLSGMIEKARYEYLNEDDTSLQALVDDIQNVYSNVFNKLRNLK